MSKLPTTPSDVSRAITQAAKDGEEYERTRVLDLIQSYWCGEPECTKHQTDWPALISAIKEEK